MTLIGTTRPSWSPAREPGVALGPRPVLPRGREEVARPGLQLDPGQESRPQRTTARVRTRSPDASRPDAPRPPRGSRGPASVGSGRPANAVRSRFIHGSDKTCHVLPRGVQGSARSFPQSRTSRPPGWKGGASPALLRFPWRLRCPAKGITWCRVHGRKRQETRRAREFPTVPGPFATCFFT